MRTGAMGTEGTPAYLLWGMRPRPQWLSKMDRLAGSEPRRGERPAHSLPIPFCPCVPTWRAILAAPPLQKRMKRWR